VLSISVVMANTSITGSAKARDPRAAAAHAHQPSGAGPRAGCRPQNAAHAAQRDLGRQVQTSSLRLTTPIGASSAGF
jgi:hypothetical protein